MQIDTSMMSGNLGSVARTIQEIEALGYDGVWTAEAGHDPFLPLAVAAPHSERVVLGTNIVVSFPRSPLVLAQTAWDLAQASRGRFILGLGTQVKGHNERRYSTPWTAPGPRLREQIQLIRHIWDVWQNGTRPGFAGKYYQFSLMTPFFSPGPIEWPNIPIYIAGVNPYICKLAGELCDGFLMHPFHSLKYFRETIRPQMEAGLAKAGRRWGDCQVTTTAFVIMGKDRDEIATMREAVRQQIAFYASTRAYLGVLEAHGWGDVSAQLNERVARGDWTGMAALITDEMLHEYALEGVYADVPDLLKKKYTGVLDRLGFYAPYGVGNTPAGVWKDIIQGVRG